MVPIKKDFLSSDFTLAKSHARLGGELRLMLTGPESGMVTSRVTYPLLSCSLREHGPRAYATDQGPPEKSAAKRNASSDPWVRL